jgi:hypothetical protein
MIREVVEIMTRLRKSRLTRRVRLKQRGRISERMLKIPAAHKSFAGDFGISLKTRGRMLKIPAAHESFAGNFRSR